MTGRINLTYPLALVLGALGAGYSYGFDIMEATGLPSGTVYPLLRRLETGSFVTANWEHDESAHREGRPPRRYYALTDSGRDLLVRARTKISAGSTGLLFGDPRGAGG